MDKKRAPNVDISTKYAIVMAAASGRKTQEEIRKEFGLKYQSQVANFVKKKDEIVVAFETFTKTSNKSLKKPKFPELEEHLVEFIDNITSRGGKVSRRLVATGISKV